MSRRERVAAALLFATAVAGYALVPRLLLASGQPRVGAQGPGLGRSVLPAVAIPAAPRRTALPNAPHLPARVTTAPAALVGPVAPGATQPASNHLLAQQLRHEWPQSNDVSHSVAIPSFG